MGFGEEIGIIEIKICTLPRSLMNAYHLNPFDIFCHITRLKKDINLLL